MEISIINTSNVSDDIINNIIHGIENMMSEFEKDWGVTAKLNLNGNSTVKLYVSSIEGLIREPTYAYHGVKRNIPYGRVYIYKNFDLRLISTLISHEIFEIIVNPLRNKYNNLFELEVCDPVIEQSFLEPISNVYISNWVTPAWFTSESPPFDKMNIISESRTLSPGGYIKKK